MSDPISPNDKQPDKPKISTTRIVIWVVVTGIAVYYLVSAAIGFANG